VSLELGGAVSHANQPREARTGDLPETWACQTPNMPALALVLVGPTKSRVGIISTRASGIAWILLPHRRPRYVGRRVGPRRSRTAVPRDRGGCDSELRRPKRATRADVGGDRQGSRWLPHRSRACDPGLGRDPRRLVRDLARRPAGASDRADLPPRCRRVGRSRSGNAQYARALSQRSHGQLARDPDGRTWAERRAIRRCRLGLARGHRRHQPGLPRWNRGPRAAAKGPTDGDPLTRSRAFRARTRVLSDGPAWTRTRDLPIMSRLL
jgi:hypothetical protein